MARDFKHDLFQMEDMVNEQCIKVSELLKIAVAKANHYQLKADLIENKCAYAQILALLDVLQIMDVYVTIDWKFKANGCVKVTELEIADDKVI